MACGQTGHWAGDPGCPKNENPKSGMIAILDEQNEPDDDDDNYTIFVADSHASSSMSAKMASFIDDDMEFVEPETPQLETPLTRPTVTKRVSTSDPARGQSSSSKGRGRPSKAATKPKAKAKAQPEGPK